MKRLAIGMAAAAMALGVIPASASLSEDLYTGVSNYTPTYFKGYVEVSGLKDLVDQNDLCQNGDPLFTIFAPIDSAFDGGDGTGGNPGAFDLWETTYAKSLAKNGWPDSIVNDHVVQGSISPAELENGSLTLTQSRSGLRINVTSTATPRVVPGTVQVNGITILAAEQYCNGWVYLIDGILSSKPQVPVTGVDAKDEPKAEVKPAEVLPNTL